MPFHSRTDPELEPDGLRRAHARIHPAFRDTPQYHHEDLSRIAGRDVVVKVECINPIRSFKGRGTWLAVEGLAGEGRLATDRPVVAASTGNFGQGLAFAARAHGLSAIVFADAHANPVKLGRMRALGATVIQEGSDFDEARTAAASYASSRGAHLLTDGEDPRVAAGAATLALEVTDAAAAGAVPLPSVAYVPLGNGALIVGVAAWLRHAAPACRIVGVAAAAAPCMVLSWNAGAVIEAPAGTYAEGIACRVPVPEALDMMVGRVDDLILVTEEQLLGAQAALTAATGITVEGAAAASWAGLVADRAGGVGAALVILTGSNVPAA